MNKNVPLKELPQTSDWQMYAPDPQDQDFNNLGFLFDLLRDITKHLRQRASEDEAFYALLQSHLDLKGLPTESASKIKQVGTALQYKLKENKKK